MLSICYWFNLELICLQSSSTGCSSAGVYVEEGPDRDALTEALARENYLPVYLDPRTVGNSTLRLQYKPYLPPYPPPPPPCPPHLPIACRCDVAATNTNIQAAIWCQSSTNLAVIMPAAAISHAWQLT